VKLPDRKRAFQIDAISIGCGPVRLGRNFGTLREFTKWLNLAAETHVQDSDGVSVDSEASSRIRKLPLPQPAATATSQQVAVLPGSGRVGPNLHPQRVGWASETIGIRPY
jgi:hypothetical protein